MSEPLPLAIRALTSARWGDFENLLVPRGACSCSWCMFWKLPNREYRALAYEGNETTQKAIVENRGVPGLLAYAAREAVGWIAVDPRSAYPRLANLWVLKPVDDQPVWSVTCLFTRGDHRGRGITVALLRGAVEYVLRGGGRIVEGYPVERKSGAMPPAVVYTGLASASRGAGFGEVARRSATRPIFRDRIGD